MLMAFIQIARELSAVDLENPLWWPTKRLDHCDLSRLAVMRLNRSQKREEYIYLKF